MKQIDAAAAQDDLDRLLDEVQRGETIVLTRNGKPVGRLISEEEGRRQDTHRAIEEIKELRKRSAPVTVAEILAWRDEGRK